ncbi:unnamed protein product [Ectocarpus sp. 12 AP-2014]
MFDVHPARSSVGDSSTSEYVPWYYGTSLTQAGPYAVEQPYPLPSHTLKACEEVVGLCPHGVTSRMGCGCTRGRKVDLHPHWLSAENTPGTHTATPEATG